MVPISPAVFVGSLSNSAMIDLFPAGCAPKLIIRFLSVSWLFEGGKRTFPSNRTIIDPLTLPYLLSPLLFSDQKVLIAPRYCRFPFPLFVLFPGAITSRLNFHYTVAPQAAYRMAKKEGISEGKEVSWETREKKGGEGERRPTF